MRILTRSAFAELAHVSRAAITRAVREKRLDIIEGGKTGRIDADCYKSIQYLKMISEQRSKGNIKTSIKSKKSKSSIPQTRKLKLSKDKQTKDNARADKEADKAAEKRTNIIIMPRTENAIPTGPRPAGEPPDLSAEEKEYAQQIETIEKLAERYNVAKTHKIEEQATSEKLKNARIRGELVDREKVYNNLFMYLDKLHSNLERLADSFLSDIGPLMVDAGKVMPEHRESWHDEVLSQIDESKKGMVKMLKKIEKDQSK